jgi:integrase
MHSLYTRNKIVLPTGSRPSVWRYQRVKEGRGVKTAGLVGPFYARSKYQGRTTWTKLQSDTLNAAKAEAGDRIAERQANAATVAPAVQNGTRTTIRAAIDRYLDQKAGKAAKTKAQYRTALEQFLEAVEVRVRFLDEISPDVMRLFKKFQEKRQYSGKTIDTRINIVNFLLKKNGITARLPKDEMPVVQVEAAVPYPDELLQKLFAAMDEVETLLYRFFLGSGCRDQEVTFAEWADINFSRSEYTVRGKPAEGFTPKSHESRTIKLPTSLMVLLKAAHKKKTHDRWIFANKDGNPENHSLRKLKRIALNANLNCGHCRVTMNIGRYKPKVVEVSCATHPVCQHFYLHRFRKTCATRWIEAGISIKKVQVWLGHKSLETTERYLGAISSDKDQGMVDSAAGD